MTGFKVLFRWLPAAGMMGLIFYLSSLTSTELPYFGTWDFVLKKGAHALGYAFLGLAYYYALPGRLSIFYKLLLAWIMALLFALSDEFHQSFVQGRTSSLQDVAIDVSGAALALLAAAGYSSNSSSKSRS